MSKVALIIKQEYIRRVRKKSFVLLTFITPLLMVALVFLPLWLASIKGDEVRNIAVVDYTGRYASLFKDVDNYHFLDTNKSLDEYRKSDNKDLFAILNITDDLLINPKAAVLYSEKQIPGDLSRMINQVLTKQMESDKLASFHIPNLDNIIKESRIQFNIQTIKWDNEGNESSSSSSIAYFIGLLSTIVIYMFIMMYGAMVMQGVTEEKTNRIVEIMVSSVRPFSLMIGKIVGIGLVGLTQIVLWGILTGLLIAVGGLFLGDVNNGIDAATAMQQGNPMPSVAIPSDMEWMSQLQSFNFHEIIFFFVIYFIGGYLLYASLFAAIGSAVNSSEDTQQFMAPISILLMFALYAGVYSLDNPDGPLAFWCSMIPFTSPIVMLMRIPYEIPLWEKLLSVVLLYSTSISFVWISAKIYRVGILMYGKKPRLKEIIKWITFR